MTYDPTVGRWLSEDPIGFEGEDPNLYRYVGNSPTNFTDPSGLQAAPRKPPSSKPPGTPAVNPPRPTIGTIDPAAPLSPALQGQPVDGCKAKIVIKGAVNQRRAKELRAAIRRATRDMKDALYALENWDKVPDSAQKRLVNKRYNWLQDKLREAIRQLDDPNTEIWFIIREEDHPDGNPAYTRYFFGWADHIGIRKTFWSIAPSGYGQGRWSQGEAILHEFGRYYHDMDDADVQDWDLFIARMAREGAKLRQQRKDLPRK
jgi:uncharacterized protein RhaS with RHS repeats